MTSTTIRQSPSRVDNWTDLWVPLAIGVVFVLINFRWIYLFRVGQPLDIDEAGYLSISLNYFRSMISGGLGGWIDSVAAPSSQAPVTTVLSSLVYAVLVPSPLVGFLVTLGFGLLTVISTYYLAEIVGGRRLAILTGIVVACSPAILNGSRTYHFAITAAGVATFALLALAKSERLSRLPWTILFGISVGLLPLARTMAIAFVPAFVAAAAVQAYCADDRRKAVRNLLLALGLAILTAAVWLLPNGHHVFPYLFSFGYGDRAAYYGPQEETALSLASFLYFIQNLGYHIFLANFILIFAGLVFLVLTLVERFRSSGFTPVIQQIARSPALPSALLVLEGTLALASSQNKGSAFITPLVPSMLLLGTWGLLGWKEAVAWQKAVSGFVLAVAIVSLLPMLDLRLRAAIPRVAEFPIIGGVYVTDGRGSIQKYEASGGYSTDNPVMPIDVATGRAWLATNDASAKKLAQVSAETLPIALALRHRLYNVNTLHMARLLAGKPQLPLVAQIETDVVEATVPGYAKWLESGSHFCFLLTASSGKGEMTPAVNPKFMETAARDAGFQRIDNWPLPDGRIVKLWRSARPACGIRNAVLGDVFGQVQPHARDELFVHPGLKTSTSFEVALDGAWKSVTLSIPEKTLKSCPDANGTTVSIEIGGQKTWEGIVKPRSPASVPLPGEGARDAKFVVGNNGEPNCDHLFAKFTR